MLIYINEWTKKLNNVKFLNTHPVEKDSILSLYSIVSKAFSNLGIYSKAPLLPLPHIRMRTHPPHSKPILPPSSSSHCPCGSTSYFGCWCYCGWQCMEEEEGGGTSWNIMQHDMCLHQSPPPPLHLFCMTCAHWGAKIMCMTCQQVLHVDLSFKGLAVIAAISTHPMAPLANLLWLWLS